MYGRRCERNFDLFFFPWLFQWKQIFILQCEQYFRQQCSCKFNSLISFLKRFSQFDVEEDVEENYQELLLRVIPLIAKKIITIEKKHTIQGINMETYLT